MKTCTTCTAKAARGRKRCRKCLDSARRAMQATYAHPVEADARERIGLDRWLPCPRECARTMSAGFVAGDSIAVAPGDEELCFFDTADEADEAEHDDHTWEASHDGV